MLAYINGRYQDEADPAISIFDRSFRYGDGLFETIRITGGKPFLWKRHFLRLNLGATYLRFNREAIDGLENVAESMIQRNRITDGVLRIQISRGIGARGYSPRDADSPFVVITTQSGLLSPPEKLRLLTTKFRVMADEPWTQLKTANRLQNVLARSEADDAEVDDVLILNHRWTISSASAANVFCIRGETLLTPPLAAGCIAGTTRAFVIHAARKIGIEVREQELTLEDFHQSEAAFLTSAGILVGPIESLDSKTKNWQHPMIRVAQNLCEDATE
jgi:branched-chain amino acid aminotransferase